MALVRLNRINRLFLVAWTAGVLAIAVRDPTLGPLGTLSTMGPVSSLPPSRVQYGALVLLWIAGVGLTLAWQRKLWTTMGSGAGFTADGGPGLFRLPTMHGTVRERTVTAEAVRRGWSPLARLRLEAAIDVDTPARLELAITTGSDPEGTVLFDAPDADRRYVLRENSGDLDGLLATDYKAELLDVDLPGTLRVEGSHASFELSHIPFNAGKLWTCARTTVRLAERVETVSGRRRSQ